MVSTFKRPYVHVILLGMLAVLLAGLLRPAGSTPIAAQSYVRIKNKWQGSYLWCFHTVMIPWPSGGGGCPILVDNTVQVPVRRALHKLS